MNCLGRLYIFILFVAGHSGIYADTFFVTNFGDSLAPGSIGSLRKAVYLANINPGPDNILFAVGDTLKLTAGAISITDEVFIDGYGYAITLTSDQPSLDTIFTVKAANTTITRFNFTAARFAVCVQAPNVIISANIFTGCNIAIFLLQSGASILNNQFGVTSGDDVVTNFMGVDDASAGYHTIRGNRFAASQFTDIRLGTGFAENTGRGSLIVGNKFGFNSANAAIIDTVYGNSALFVYGNANKIGDGTYAGRNVIGSYTTPVYLIGDSTFVAGNFFGLYPDGKTPAKPPFGAITIDPGNYTQIGNGTTAGRNIFGYAANAVDMMFSHHCSFLGNYFGTDSTGNAPGNVSFGIGITGGSFTQIGNGTPGGRNIFWASTDGVNITSTSANNMIYGNYFGLGANGSTSFAGNSGISNSSDNLTVGDGTASGVNYFTGMMSSAIVNSGKNFTLNRNVIGLAADGTTLKANASGLFQSGSGGIIRNNVFAGQVTLGSGISLNADSNIIESNLIGTDINGTASYGFDRGINIYGRHNRIGNGSPNGRNYIVGGLINIQLGFFAHSDTNWVSGNYIGLGKNGNAIRSAAFGGTGVFIDSSKNTVLTNNVIGGSSGHGITINRSSGVLIQNNLIGTDSNGIGAQSNDGAGVLINFRCSRVAVNNNTIAYNGFYGLYLEDADSDSIRWSQNLIFKNVNGGILKVDAGSQKGIQPPRIWGGLTSGTIWGKSAPNAKIEVFMDSTGLTQARYYAGATTATPSGDWAFHTGEVHVGHTFTAIQDSAANSSVFSNRIDVTATADLFAKHHSPDAFFPMGNVHIGDSLILPIRFYSEGGSLISGFSVLHSTPFQFIGPSIDTLDILHPDTLLGFIKFKPTAIGNFIDTIRATYDVRKLDVYITGTGVNRVLSTGAIGSFSDARIGDSSSASVTIKAPQSPVSVTAISLEKGTHFKILPWVLPVTITSDSLILTIRFKPLVEGILTDTVNIFHNGAGSPIRLPLSGIGLENISPILSIGVLRSTILKDQVEIYGTSNEGLSFVVIRVNNSNKATTAVSGSTRIFSTDHKMLSAGVLSLNFAGTDSAGNRGEVSKNYDVGELTKNRWMTLTSSSVELRQLKNYTGSGGYVFLSTQESREIKSDKRYIRSVEVIMTEAVSLKLAMNYYKEDIQFIQQEFGCFDAQKLSIQEISSVHAGMNVSTEHEKIAATIYRSGLYALVYDPVKVIIPQKLELTQNYPNPFNPSTTIRFGLPEDGKIRLVIYNILGQTITTLISENKPAGYHEVFWDGKNNRGEPVSSGIYLYRLETGKGTISKKMLLIK